MAKKIEWRGSYGVDAPGIILRFFAIAVLTFTLAFLLPVFHVGPVVVLARSMWIGMTISFAGTAIVMLSYSLSGKFTYARKLLAMAKLDGTERVLDVGTGSGLLLTGAAQLLTSGHATGIDIWNAEDLSGNAMLATEKNITAEGVDERTTVLSMPAQSMDFADASFQVIVSNMCLHNIYDKVIRAKALGEIARVLAPGGVAILADYKLTAEYEETLKGLGLKAERKSFRWLGLFPVVAVIARKG